MDTHSDDFYNLIFQVNTDFYEYVYNDNWFKQVFVNITQEVITKQQTDFIIQAFGGPANYCGRMPGDAHPHIFIDEYMWELREKYLIQSFEKNNTPADIRNKWLKIDNAFKAAILKKSVDDLKPRFKTDELVIVMRNKN
jgi:truncated hemoglobin YjbI